MALLETYGMSVTFGGLKAVNTAFVKARIAADKTSFKINRTPNFAYFIPGPSKICTLGHKKQAP